MGFEPGQMVRPTQTMWLLCELPEALVNNGAPLFVFVPPYHLVGIVSDFVPLGVVGVVLFQLVLLGEASQDEVADKVFGVPLTIPGGYPDDAILEKEGYGVGVLLDVPGFGNNALDALVPLDSNFAHT